MGYIYKFINKDEEIIYIGKTSGNIGARISSHGHLPNDCYDEVKRIECGEVTSNVDLAIYELYYINKYKPFYNTKSKLQDELSLKLDDLIWVDYRELKQENSHKTATQSQKIIEEANDSRKKKYIKKIQKEIQNTESSIEMFDTMIEYFNVVPVNFDDDLLKTISDNADRSTVDYKFICNDEQLSYLFKFMNISYNCDKVSGSCTIIDRCLIKKSNGTNVCNLKILKKWLPYLHYIYINIDQELKNFSNKLSKYTNELI